MAKYSLFGPSKNAAIHRKLEVPDEILQATIILDGGTIFASGSIQIDAAVRNARVVARKKQPVLVSALGRMLACFIQGHDVVIEGDFAGEIEASGDVEVTNSAQISGVIRCSGEVVFGPLANRNNVRVQRLTLRVEEVKEPSHNLVHPSKDALPRLDNHA